MAGIRHYHGNHLTESDSDRSKPDNKVVKIKLRLPGQTMSINKQSPVLTNRR
jgi:hypothetical protein